MQGNVGSMSHRDQGPALLLEGPPTPKLQDTNKYAAPLNNSPENTYPRPHNGLLPLGLQGHPPGDHPLIYPATKLWRELGCAGLVGGIPFSAKHICMGKS